MKNLYALILATLLPMLAGAQNLVVFDASGIVENDQAPHYAVFTEQYYYSPEWAGLEDKISRYQAAHAFHAEATSEPNEDWDELVRTLEADIERFTREGNHEMAKTCRETLEEMKKVRQETEALFRQAATDARTNAQGLDAQTLLAEVRKKAVGQQLFHSASLISDDQLAMVRDKSWDEAETNAWGIMDPNGRIIIPCRYEMINSWENIIIAYRVISYDKDQWEVRLYRPDGSNASGQTFTGARGNYNVYTGVNHVSVRFADGGWGLINPDGQVITTRKYDEIGPGSKLFNNADHPDLWAGRGGKMYLLSPDDGHETGTFTYEHRDSENNFSGVNITWFK